MAQSQIAFRESFHYWNGNAMTGRTCYMTLIRGSLFPVGAGVITSSSTLAGLTECSGTGYARVSFVLGTDTNGIMAVPAVVFTNLTNAWSADCAAAVMCSAASGGIGIYCWDGPSVADMSVVGSTLTIPASYNVFTENPGGV